MAKLNLKPRVDEFTHEGGRAFGHLTVEQQLRRSVSACLLWENQFYEDGESVAERIVKTAEACSPAFVASLAIEARSKLNLRHAPLLLLTVLAKTGKGLPLVPDTIEVVIQRADELAEFLMVQSKVNGTKPRRFSHGVRKGLARAFRKFDAYQLGKYNRDGAVKLRDVLFLTHAKPANEAQAALWRSLVARELDSPDTWEVGLSGGADKRETFERLLRERKLGYLALLRNLRNMVEAKVDESLIREAILARKGGAERVLPFRYVAAARAVPMLEPVIDQALQAAIIEQPPLPGRTLAVVDVSPSMDDKLSSKSDLTRMDAAAALASIIQGDLRVFSFSARGYRHVSGMWGQIQHDGVTPVLVEVPPRRGMAGVDAILRSQERNGTLLGRAVHEANAIPHDRLIVLTDEQSHDRVPDPVSKRAYMINVGSNQNGVGYGRWTHIDGFSESVLRFIVEHESATAP